MIRIAGKIALTVVLGLAGDRSGAEELVELATRANVTQSFLYAAPADPRAIAILFPGGDGIADLAALRGRFELARGNFLIRSRIHFLDAGIATVLLTTPSDQAAGMQDHFRLGREHATDVSAVIDTLREKHKGVPVFLVGTSRGTVSAAGAASTVDVAIAGVVLTATVTQPAGRRSPPGLGGFDFARIKARLLFVHHRDDACLASPYSGARRIGERFALITVHGGDPPRAEPCQALTPHGFLGQEKKTVQAIANWMLGMPHPNTIE
jgi:pimeloyl-ACP methyl ester carboxylesterase